MQEGIHFSRELESAVLGICMLEKTAFGRVYGLVDEKTFYVTDNQNVFACMRQMYDENIPVDTLTVWQRLTEQNETFNAGDIAWYLTGLTRNVVASGHMEYHCHLLKNMWRKRELEALTHSGFDSHGDVKKQIAELNDQLHQIRGSEYKRDWYDMSELMYDLMIHQVEIKEGKKDFLTTGLKAIDRLNGGFSPGNLIVIGARPSVGKSAFMGQMAIAMAKQGKKVGIVSLEMNNNEIAARLASLETDIEFSTIYRNLFKDQRQHEFFYDTISKNTINLPIYVSDKTKVDINEIRAKAAKLINTKGCDCIMVDYLQLIEEHENKNRTREQEVSKISRGLKLMAIEMKMPVVELCQLNRAVTGRGAKDRYPKLSDLRESGSIEQDADVVMMLHRDWLAGYETDANDHSTEFEADLLGLKWRNGAPFHLKLDFDPPKMRFMEQSISQGWVPVNVELFKPYADD